MISVLQPGKQTDQPLIELLVSGSLLVGDLSLVVVVGLAAKIAAHQVNPAAAYPDGQVECDDECISVPDEVGVMSAPAKDVSDVSALHVGEVDPRHAEK